jgi:hypothetical protein
MTIFLALQFMMTSDLDGRIFVAGTHDPVPVSRVRIERLGLTIHEMYAHDGRFQFRNLVSARYTVVVDSPGYETSYSEVNLPGESFAIIDLRAKQAPLPGNPERPATGNTLRHLLHKLFS